MDTLGPDIFGHILLQYRGFPLSEVENVKVIPVGSKFFVLIMVVFLFGPKFRGFVKKGSTV